MADKDTEAPQSGVELKAWRTRMGWSQARAANELGMHVHFLKNLEAGKRNIRASVRRLLAALEKRGSRGTKLAPGGRPEPVPEPTPAPAAEPGTTDAELVEVGRRYAKLAAVHVTALLEGTVTPGLQAAMEASQKEVQRIQAMPDPPFSETAMAVFGAFILVSTAAEKATLAALTTRDSSETIATAADMRNMTLRDVVPTLPRGGQGTSVNAVPSVLVVQNIRRARTGSAPPAADMRAEPPADVSRSPLKAEDLDVLDLIWHWTRQSALLTTDILDGKGDGRADKVDVLRQGIASARDVLSKHPRSLATEMLEAAVLSNGVTYRLMTERGVAQEALSEAESTVYALDRRNQSVSTDVAYTVTAEGEGARQPIFMLNTGMGVPVQVTRDDLEELSGSPERNKRRSKQ